LRGRTYLICAIVLAVLVLLNLPAPSSLYIKTATRGNLAPFQNVLWFLSGRVPETLSSIIASGKISDEKRRLIEEAANLRYQIRQLNALEKDNEELRAQLGFKSTQKCRLVLCEVVARGDTSGWWQILTLNRGAMEGIRPNIAVVTTEGLIGRTTDVSRHSCDVLLITDPNCKVACKLVRTGALGIVKGEGAALIGRARVEMFTAMQPCRMDYISKEKPVFIGDEVVTSGLGGVFPEGLLIGRVVEVGTDSTRLYQQADVTPAADISSVKYAFVVVEEKVPNERTTE
jgi:rod shape-determining protein MreC